MKQKKCFGKTPERIQAIRPLKDGVIADFTATELMLKNIMKKVAKRYKIGSPRVVVGVPSGITEVEKRAVEEAVLQSGAREVYLIEEPMAAAIGAGLPVGEPSRKYDCRYWRRNNRSRSYFIGRNCSKSLAQNCRRRIR